MQDKMSKKAIEWVKQWFELRSKFEDAQQWWNNLSMEEKIYLHKKETEVTIEKPYEDYDV